jgi:LysR family transcriptional regulator, transcriptional activator of nhaA
LLTENPVILPTADSTARIGFDALTDRLGIRPRVVAEVDLPPVVVRDELTQGSLVEAYKLTGVTEAFYAVTVARRYPNLLLSDLLEAAAYNDVNAFG